MKEFEYTIKDELGLHARPAGLLVKQAATYQSKLTIEKVGGKSADLKRLFGVMGLAVKCGETIKVTAEGEDEAAAAEALEEFFKANF
ncbi:MAG: HPr family phosphocarrier protein [Clostridiales bacterium]|uniref:HPr family phosphocarrier protein n=1 Tax=Oscillospiraceae TaxID=216572 RepID=UPI0009A807E0|nr:MULTISPECIES: HPr family phosphocarrier protein [Oscillospiraceae]PWM34262.1 MAG: HPr family phosphocarrier protein [Clostridiales bacterium]RGB63713.1 HPr family phosphocarrier protein [Harryflintia acetispora]